MANRFSEGRMHAQYRVIGPSRFPGVLGANLNPQRHKTLNGHGNGQIDSSVLDQAKYIIQSRICNTSHKDEKLFHCGICA
jgi:hypothetical protein